MLSFKAIGVFCGSSAGLRADYAVQAAELGRLLASEGIRLIYGGGNVGLMGIMADACLEAGGLVTGVITEKLRDVELAHAGASEMIVTGDMPERKSTIVRLSDAFIAMPGGYGTFDELFEVLTLVQLNINPKPVGLLNVASYFNPMLDMIDKAVDERFIRAEHRAVFAVRDQAASLLEAMRDWKPVETAKWLDNFKHTKH